MCCWTPVKATTYVVRLKLGINDDKSSVLEHRRNRAPWNELFQMDADVALLQEVKAIPKELPEDVDLDPGGFGESWEKDLYDRWPMVVKLSSRVKVEWFRRVLPISEPEANEVAVSGIGTIAAARVLPKEGEAFIAISMYARWIRPHVSTRSSWKVGYADGSAHRIISDLCALYRPQ